MREIKAGAGSAGRGSAKGGGYNEPPAPKKGASRIVKEKKGGNGEENR